MTPAQITRPPASLIRATRERHGLTQAQAAAAVAGSARQWQKWEATDGMMPLGLWWLFLLRLGEIDPSSLPPVPPRQRFGAVAHG